MKFRNSGIKATCIRNYPILNELRPDAGTKHDSNLLCYVGGISSNRGIRELVTALALCQRDVRLALAGTINERGLRTELEAMPGWTRVDDLGFLDRQGVRRLLARSLAGLVTLHPTKAFLDSLPIKMFEYMSASLPIIASDFPGWRTIVEGNNCGICVDPKSPEAIAEAIDSLVDDQQEARRMGESGRIAATAKYSWNAEAKRLSHLYSELSRLSMQKAP